MILFLCSLWSETALLIRWPTWPVKQVELFFEFPVEGVPCGRSQAGRLFHLFTLEVTAFSANS
jgi:hypothetical protein